MVTIGILLCNVGNGGTLRHVHELIEYWSKKQSCRVIFIDIANRLVKNTIYIHDQKQKKYYVFDNIELVAKILHHYHVQLLHVEHTLDTLPEYLQLHNMLQVPLVVTLHDYYTVCPFIQLTYEDHRYCEEKGEADCNRCLARRGFYSKTLSKHLTNISEWRDFWYNYLKEANLVIVPSVDEQERLQRYFPGIKIEMKENPEMILPSFSSTNDVVKKTRKDSKKREIGLIGALYIAKGAQMIKDCLTYCAEHRVPIHFTLFGTLHEVNLTEEEKKYITILGPYKENEVYEQIFNRNIDFFWFTPFLPETYSYTLSIPVRLHIPCLATNLGAIDSRIHQHHWGDTYDWKLDAAHVVEKLLEFPFDSFREKDFVITNTSFGTLDEYYDGLISVKDSDGQYKKGEREVAVPEVFSTIKGTLASIEFSMLWKDATKRQKMILLRHVDIKWLKGVWQNKGWKYFVKRLREKL